MLQSADITAVRYRCPPQRNFSFSLDSVVTKHDCSKADACDVINFEEYEDVANKILERKPTRAVTIFVDMKDVERSIKVCALV